VRGGMGTQPRVLNSAGFAVVRQDAAARRTRPPSRNALSAVFQREGALLFLFLFSILARSPLVSAELAGGDY